MFPWVFIFANWYRDRLESFDSEVNLAYVVETLTFDQLVNLAYVIETLTFDQPLDYILVEMIYVFRIIRSSGS